MSELPQPDQDQSRKKPSRTETSVLYLAFSYLSIVMAMIRGLVLVPVYLRYIDERIYGAWLATGGALAYLSLVDLGFTAVIRQQVAEAFGRDQNSRIAGIVGTGFAITMSLSVLMIAIGLLLSYFLPGWLRVYGDQGSQLQKAIVIAAIANGLTLFAYSVSDAMIGLQRVIGVNLLNLLGSACGLGITVFGLLYQNWGLLAIPTGALARALFYLISLCVQFIFVWARHIGLWPKFIRSQLRNLTGLVGYVFLGRIAETVILRSDELIVAHLLGAEFVTVYTLTGRAKDVVRSVPDRIGFSVVPGLANLYGEQGLNVTSKRALQVLNITLGVTIACAAGVFAFNRPFVELWVGTDLFGGIVLTAAICLYFVLISIRTLLAQLLFAIGEVKRPNRLLLVESIVRLPLAILFTQQLGLVGLPLGASISLLLTNGVFLTHFFFRRMQFDRADITQRLSGQIAYMVLALSIVYPLSQWVHPSDWLDFALWTVSFALMLGSMLYVLNQDFRSSASHLFTQIVHRPYFKRIRARMN